MISLLGVGWLLVSPGCLVNYTLPEFRRGSCYDLFLYKYAETADNYVWFRQALLPTASPTTTTDRVFTIVQASWVLDDPKSSGVAGISLNGHN